MKKNIILFPLFIVAAALLVGQGVAQNQITRRPDGQIRKPPHTSHTPGLSVRSLHPSFYDRKTEWQAIINQFWGPGESTAGKLYTFDLYQSYARAYNSTFVWNPVNWDSTAAALRSRINDSTSRGGFSRILNDLAFALHDGHAYAYDNVMLTTPLNPGTPIWADGGFLLQHSGMGLTPLADSSLLVYKVAPNHPLGLVPGDIILGYEGVPWRQLVRELLDGEVPHDMWIGAAPSAFERTLLWSAGESWHLFDTIDVVKHATGQTVHLPLDSMVNLNVQTQMANNEQLPVPGVPMPVYDPNSGAVTHGIIQGTNIGYIYVWHHAYGGVSSEFDAAVRALMGTDGLIIDLRLDWGGGYGLNAGISRLMNHGTPTLDLRARCSPGDLYSLCPISPSWWVGPIPADIGTYYDRPIAVLLGPNCLSYGDFTSWQLRYVSNTRMFGRSPEAIFSGYNNSMGPVRTGYTMGCTDMTAVDHFAPTEPRWGQEYPIDEEVWLTPDDVANGYDTVVRRAQAWIQHAAYANRVRVASTYVRPGLDSNTVVARLNNPDGHLTRLEAFVRNDLGVLLDSLQMFDDGLHGDSLAGDGLYGARLARPATEDEFCISVTTYDLTNGVPYRLTHAAHYFSSGPFEVVGHAFYPEYDTIPNPGDQLSMELFVRNLGLQDTLRNLSFRVVPLDTFITCQTYTNNLPQLPPGAVDSTWYWFDVSISAATPGGTNHALRVEGFSDTYPAWADTFQLYVYPPVSVKEEPGTLPLTTKLEQNYPNPFNPTTEIRFQVAGFSLVTLRVYDVLGREVATLVNEMKQPGRYTVQWNAGRFAGGVYYCRLQVGSFVDVKKLVLLR